VPGSAVLRPAIIRDEEESDRQVHPGVLERRPHAGGDAALARGHRVHDAGGVGRREHAHCEPVAEQQRRERRVVEVGGQEQHQAEGGRRRQHAAGGEWARPKPVGQVAGDGPGDQEAGRHGQHADGRPQRRLLEAEAVQGEPDPLQPDDEHEQQAASPHGGEEPRQVAGGEGGHAEEAEPEHGLGYQGLDEGEGRQQRHAAGEFGQHRGVGPAHVAMPVGLDSVRDAHQDRDQAGGERQVAPPVHPRPPRDPDLVQLEIGPDGAEQADRHRDQEHEVPVGGGEQASEDQPDEGAGDPGRGVDAEGRTTLVLGKGVGQDGDRVGHQHRAADALDDPQADQRQRRGRAPREDQRQADRGGGEDGEAEVVHPHAPEHVADPAQAHHQDGGDHHVAHQHPQQVADVQRDERVQVDAAKDGGQRDQDDRGVDGRHQDPDRRVGEGYPLVVAAAGIRHNHAGDPTLRQPRAALSTPDGPLCRTADDASRSITHVTKTGTS
jgi:hypothetical protein